MADEKPNEGDIIVDWDAFMSRPIVNPQQGDWDVVEIPAGSPLMKDLEPFQKEDDIG